MSKLHQVTEEDLAELEQLLPQFCEAMTPILNSRLKVQLRRCQTILSNVRWGYGPPEAIERIEMPDQDHQD